MRVPSTGREAFTPVALLAGRVYRLTISGTYTYRAGFLDERKADAVFRTDDGHNFKKRYDGIEINGQSSNLDQLDSWSEDRVSHTYTCLVEGMDVRIPLRVQPPKAQYSEGFLSVKIELLPAGTPSVIARQQARAQAEAASLQAERDKEEELRQAAEQALVLQKAQKKQRQAASKQQRITAEFARLERDLESQVDELKRMVHMNRNMSDAEFRSGFVRKHQGKVRQELATAWGVDYHAVLGNPALADRLKKRAPEVLQWYEDRLSVSLAAERAEVLPGHGTRAVPLTPHASESAKEVIAELYRTQEARDALERSSPIGFQVLTLNSMTAAINTGLSQLSRYGVSADSPEAAEQQLLRLIVERQVNTPYEEVRDKLAAGRSVGVDIITERVKDLFREQCILVAHRRNAIRKRQWPLQREFDERLAISRAEFAQWMDLLRGHGFPLELGHREQEETLEEGIVRLCQEKLRVKEVLTQLGDSEGAESAEALYAEQIANIFKPPETYT